MRRLLLMMIGMGMVSASFAQGVGVNNTSPDRMLDVEDGSGAPQLRITYTDNSVYGEIGINASGDLSLYTNSTNRITILSTGEIGIGTTSPDYQLDIYENINSGGFAVKFFHDGGNQNRDVILLQGGKDSGGGKTTYIQCNDGDGDEIGRIENYNGTFRLVDISDRRSKTNIISSPLVAIEKVQALKVVEFNRISNPDGKKITGFVAQEVLEVYPQAVSIPEDTTEYLGVSKTELIPLLTKAIQEQQVLIEENKKTIKMLIGWGEEILEELYKMSK